MGSSCAGHRARAWHRGIGQGIVRERDRRLYKFNAVEFHQLFALERVTPKELAVFHSECERLEANDEARPRGRGRPKHWYRLQPGHPLFASHVLTKVAKWGIPAYCGAAPPELKARATARERHEFASYYLSNFAPCAYALWIEVLGFTLCGRLGRCSRCCRRLVAVKHAEAISVRAGIIFEVLILQFELMFLFELVRRSINWPAEGVARV